MNKILRHLSDETRKALRAIGVVFDLQLSRLHPALVNRIVRNSRDQMKIRELALVGGAQRRSASRGSILCGSLQEPRLSTRVSSGVFEVSRYRARSSWEEVTAQPGPLVARFHEGRGYPRRQFHPDCMSQGTSLHLNLLRSFERNTPLDLAEAPSVRFLHAMSAEIGGYKRNQGRTPGIMGRTLLEAGYPREEDYPTGSDYDELEHLGAAVRAGARANRVPGIVRFTSVRAAMEASLDLSLGRILAFPVGMIVGVHLWEQWEELFDVGIIRRHTDSDQYLGGHCMVLGGWIEIEGVLYAVLLNSAGSEFGRFSPVCPGVALVSKDYLEEIMFPDAMLAFETHDTFSEAKKSLSKERTPAPTPVSRKSSDAGGSVPSAQPPSPGKILALLYGLGLVGLAFPPGLREIIALGLTVALGWLALREGAGWTRRQFRRLRMILPDLGGFLRFIRKGWPAGGASRFRS